MYRKRISETCSIGEEHKGQAGVTQRLDGQNREYEETKIVIKRVPK